MTSEIWTTTLRRMSTLGRKKGKQQNKKQRSKEMEDADTENGEGGESKIKKKNIWEVIFSGEVPEVENIYEDLDAITPTEETAEEVEEDSPAVSPAVVAALRPRGKKKVGKRSDARSLPRYKGNLSSMQIAVPKCDSCFQEMGCES